MTEKSLHTALVWLRRDLRLADNPALLEAVERAAQVIIVYIHAPDEEGDWAPGGASRWWLHHSLERLRKNIGQRGGRLILRQGNSLETLRELSRKTGAQLITWNRIYDPAARARDEKIKATLQTEGVECRSFNGALLFEPWQISTGSNTPFKVFTAFWRQCEKRLGEIIPPGAAPKKLRSPDDRALHPATLESLHLLSGRSWEAALEKCWKSGERAAHAALEEFADDALCGYATGRDRPDLQGTSRLSPHLHFGEISPRQILAYVREHHGSAEYPQRFVTEIGWREFAHHLLYHFAWTTDKPLDERFAGYPWQRSAATLKAWQQGRTGIPIVDAGMRELWHTGWMHNRVRMIVASFLTKNLRLHWREGARWFWDTLVDADLANNTLGWQWIAGCGADAAPYFRVFNPVLQAERFDPQRVYIRKWVPEIAALPDRWIHRPWMAPDDVLVAAGILLGKTYARPIVDLSKSRVQALAGYKEMRQP